MKFKAQNLPKPITIFLLVVIRSNQNRGKVEYQGPALGRQSRYWRIVRYLDFQNIVTIIIRPKIYQVKNKE
jgi:hypothetical protein